MTAPLNDMMVTSRFGWRTHPVTHDKTFHNGIDLRAAIGTPVRAPISGTAALTSSASGGKQLIITHDGGLRVGFAHLSGYGAGVAPGSKVSEGQIVAYTGQTGKGTGPHLHYTLAVVKNGTRKFYDPELLNYN